MVSNEKFSNKKIRFCHKNYYLIKNNNLIFQIEKYLFDVNIFLTILKKKNNLNRRNLITNSCVFTFKSNFLKLNQQFQANEKHRPFH